MSKSIDGVTNWMQMFRWIVKLIRDDYNVDEKVLTRAVELDPGIGISTEQLENVLEDIAECFSLRFPDCTLDQVVRLEDLCMLASWMSGLYKRPDFVSDPFAEQCRAVNSIPD
jgi:hypothetical protein